MANSSSNNGNRLIKPPAYVKADHFERVIIAATAAVSYLHRDTITRGNLQLY
jgi:hypothetical protein